MVLSSQLSRSADDLLLSYLPPQSNPSTERRARSSSPVKNRRPLPPTSNSSFYDMRVPSMPQARSNDMSSLSTSSSTTTLSPQQIKSLSNSPISKRLHITSSSSDYVIPIPFTLQLPPKLSPKNQTPNRSARSSGTSTPSRSPLGTNGPSVQTNSPIVPHKQTRLIYTGKNYERIDSSDDDEAHDEFGDVFPPSSVPNRKPPPVVTNKRKSVKHNYQNKLLSHDELSIIEEASNSGSSRASSVKSKTFEKALPLEPHQEPHHQNHHPYNTNHQEINNNGAGRARVDPPAQNLAPKISSLPLDEESMRDVPRLNTQSHHPHCVINGRPLPPPLPTQPGQNYNKPRSKSQQHQQQQKQKQQEKHNPSSKGKQSESLAPNNVLARSEESSHFNLQFIAPSPHINDAQRTHDAHPLVLNPNITKSKIPPPTANLVRQSDMPRNFERAMQYSTTSNPYNKNVHEMGTNNRENVLKIYKRSFSDESHVSSISSFSSMGDFMNVSSHPSFRSPNKGNTYTAFPPGANKCGPMAQNNGNTKQLVEISENPSIEQEPNSIQSKKGELMRNSSEASSKSASSRSTESSWNSLQKSIDISIEDSLHSPPANEFEFGLKPNTKELPPLPMVEETAPLRISRNTSRKPSREVSPEKRPMENNKPRRIPPPSGFDDEDFHHKSQPPSQDTINVGRNKKQDDSDNEGAGQRFSFPNNNNNITNSKDVKQRSISGNSSKSQKSRYSFMSQSSGQIEIPNLSNKSVAESFSTARTASSFNGTTFDDVNSNSAASSQTSLSTNSRTSGGKLEPIGVPTKASQQLVREQYKMMVGEDGSDSDYESAFSHGVKSKSSPDLSKQAEGYLTKNDTEAADASHQRKLISHQRRKSSVSPVRHRRNKSMYGIDFERNDLPVSPSRKHSRSKSTSLAQNQLQQHEPKPSMDFVINDPPKPINYEVDFKEATGNDEFSDAVSTTPSVNEIYSTPNLTVNDLDKFPNLTSLNSEIRALSQADDFKPYPDLRQVNQANDRLNGLNKKAPSLYSRSSRQSRASAGSAYSDAESVVIDLTEDNVDVCMIQRNDSNLSYRSITERKDGKDVEVVLVEEDEPNNFSRDDLSSIYSKYQNNWVSRSNSTTSTSSTGSYASAASFDSGVSSEAQLRLKPRAATIEIYRQMQSLRNANASNGPLESLKNSRRQGSLISNTSSNSANYHSKRIQPPSISQASTARRPQAPAFHTVAHKSSPNLGLKPNSQFNKESNYFDYTAAERYDFNTYMKQRAVTKPT